MFFLFSFLFLIFFWFKFSLLFSFWHFRSNFLILLLALFQIIWTIFLVWLSRSFRFRFLWSSWCNNFRISFGRISFDILVSCAYSRLWFLFLSWISNFFFHNFWNIRFCFIIFWLGIRTLGLLSILIRFFVVVYNNIECVSRGWCNSRCIKEIKCRQIPFLSSRFTTNFIHVL